MIAADPVVITTTHERLSDALSTITADAIDPDDVTEQFAQPARALLAADGGLCCDAAGPFNITMRGVGDGAPLDPTGGVTVEFTAHGLHGFTDCPWRGCPAAPNRGGPEPLPDAADRAVIRGAWAVGRAVGRAAAALEGARQRITR